MRLERVLENPEQVKKLRRIFYVTLALLVGIDFFIHREHAIFFWDSIPGFSALYGFISCVLIIIVSKVIGHAGLMKREDYYDLPAEGEVEDGTAHVRGARHD